MCMKPRIVGLWPLTKGIVSYYKWEPGATISGRIIGKSVPQFCGGFLAVAQFCTDKIGRDFN